LSAQAYALQKVFHTYVKAHRGRFKFRDEAWQSVALQNQPAPAYVDESHRNAANAVDSFCRASGISSCHQIVYIAGSNNHVYNYTSSAFFFLLCALYQGTLFHKITADQCIRQLGWLSQIPSQAEAIFKHTYDMKWFTKLKALRGTMLFAGDGVGRALADEAEHLMSGIATCKSVCVKDIPSVLQEGDNSLFMAFVLSKRDYLWAVPLFELAKEKGVCAAAITMRSLQKEMFSYTDACLPFPTVEPIALPVLGIMPLQVFANDIALTKGLRAHSMLQ